MQEMNYDFMMHTFDLGKRYIIAMSILRVFSFGLYPLLVYRDDCHRGRLVYIRILL